MIAEEKQKLRKQILTLRDQMPEPIRKEKSRQILEKLYSLKIYQDADVILTYVEYLSEAHTSPLIYNVLAEGRQNKRIFVPKVTGRDMEFYEIRNFSELSKGYKGIREPRIPEHPFLTEIVRNRERENINREQARILLLMPGAVFDKQHHRIGYGMGFYDRYLEQLACLGISADTAALCFACQMLDEIPHEGHDIQPNMIITEEMIYRMDEKD